MRTCARHLKQFQQKSFDAFWAAGLANDDVSRRQHKACHGTEFDEVFDEID